MMIVNDLLQMMMMMIVLRLFPVSLFQHRLKYVFFATPILKF